MPFLTGAPGKGGWKIPGMKGPRGTTPPRWAQGKAGAAKFAAQNTVRTVMPSGKVILGPGVQGPTRAQATENVQRAEARQAHLATRYVTQAYSNKLGKEGLSLPEIGARIQQNSSKLGAERDRLLNHPEVKAANSEGKVVSPKGLSKIDTFQKQTAAIEGPKGVAHSKLYGLMPRSLRVGTKGERELAKQQLTGNQGLVARTARQAKATHEAHEPSAFDAIGHVLGGAYSAWAKAGAIDNRKYKPAPPVAETAAQASMFLPGVGIGGDVARLTEAGTRAIPGLLAEGGAKQLATSAAAKVAAKAATAKGAAEAVAHAPGALVGAAKATPEALRGLPESLRLGARAAPGVAKGAAKALPGMAGRGALRGAERSYQAGSGLALAATANRAGVPFPGGKQANALFTGQARAFSKDPGQVVQSTANLFPSFLTSAYQIPAAIGTTAGRGALTATGLSHYSGKQIMAPVSGALHSQEAFAEHFLRTYLSGKAGRVEKATLKEGLLPEILAGPLLAKATGKLGTPLLDKAREVAAARRAPLTDAEGNVLLHEHGGPLRKGTQRYPTEGTPKLTRRGEQNVQRRQEAFHAATMNDRIALEIAHRRSGVDMHARKAAGERTPVREGLGPKGKDTLHQRPPDYIGFLARAGIDLHNPDAALREIKHYEQRFAGLEHPTKYGVNPEALTARDAVKFFTEHPQELRKPDLANAVESFRAQQNGEAGLPSLGFSLRNQYLGPALMHDIQLPENRVPMAAREHTAATTREGAWNDLQARQKKAEGLRREARNKYEQAKGASGNSQKQTRLRAEAKAAYDEARQINADAKKLHAALKPFTRPGAKLVATAKRMHYDRALAQEFANETRAMLRQRGLHPEPAYVPDQAAVSRAAGDQSVTGGVKPLPGGPQMNTGYVWQHGLSRQGYEHLMNEGIARQVARNHQFDDFRRFRHERGIPFEGKYQHNGKGWARAFDQGVFNRRDVALVPTQVINRLEKATHGGDPTEYEHALAEAQAARKVSPADAQPGTIYEAFPKAAYAEKVAQVSKSTIPAAIRKANTLTSKTMLNSPAFVAMQLGAEGAQALAEVNPLRMARGMKAFSKLNPEQQLRISAASGESAKAVFSPEEVQTALGSTHAKPFQDSLSFFRRNVFGRSAKSFATQRWAGEVNRLTGSATRRATLVGAVDRDLNGMWATGRKLLKTQTELQKKIGHLPLKEQLAYIAEHPKWLDHYQKLLNDAQGGWTNITRTGTIPESARGAALVFYPFLRMSLQWPLKFAVNHPIKATALAYLASQNNWALRQALHGEPSFLNYAQIPVYGVEKNGQPTIINLTRLAPGGNALTQAVQGSGNLLGALQPVPAALIQGFTGQGTLGKAGEGGWVNNVEAAAASLLGLSPAVRAVDTLRGQKAAGQSNLGILAKRANLNAEPLEALLAKLKGSKGGQISRSMLLPVLPQDIEKQRDYTKLGRILDALSANSTSAQNKATSRAAVQKMKAAHEKASKELEGLYQKYGLTGVAQRSQEYWKEIHSSSGGGFSLGGSTKGFSLGSSSGGFSLGGGPEPKPIPFKGNGISLPGFPNIGGAIPNFLSSLVGGTAAQAATVPSVRATANQLAKRGIPGQKALSAAKALSPAQRQLLAAPAKPKAKPQPVSIEGPLTPSQKAFGAELVKLTGLSPKTVGGWLLAEDSYGAASSKEAKGDANWLNIGPGANLGSDPKAAAQKTAQLINTSGYYGGIRAAAGKGVQAEVEAIRQSPWDGAHYPNGIPTNLVTGSGGGKTQTFYANPLPAGAWSPGRSDQGFDAAPLKPNAPILAVSKGKVIATGAPGWPEGGGVVYKILKGPQKGKEIFTFEGVNPTVRPGQVVKRGQVIARGRQGGSIETGYYTGNPTVNGHPLNNTVLGTGQVYSVSSTDGQQTLGSKEFEQQILGKAVSVPAIGGNAPAYVTGPTVGAYAEATGSTAQKVAQELKSGKLTPGQLLQRLEHVQRGDLSAFGLPGLSSGEFSSLGKRVASAQSKVGTAARTLEKSKTPPRPPAGRTATTRGTTKLPIPAHHAVVKAPKVGVPKIVRGPKLSIPHVVNSAPRLTPLPKPKKAGIPGIAV